MCSHKQHMAEPLNTIKHADGEHSFYELMFSTPPGGQIGEANVVDGDQNK